MVKKQTQKSKQSKVPIFIGLLLIILSLFITPLIDYISSAFCPKDSFGHCTLSSSLMAGIITRI
jgi:hypothetical protein